MKIRTVIPLVVLGVGLVTLLTHLASEKGRADRINAALTRASELEDEQRFGEAIMVYDAALEQAITPNELANLRYRLARCLILGNNLNRALEVLQDLTDEDVANLRIDITPLYMTLGDRFWEQGNRSLSKVAYRMGDGIAITAPRKTDFAERLQRFITPVPDAPPTPAADR